MLFLDHLPSITSENKNKDYISISSELLEIFDYSRPNFKNLELSFQGRTKHIDPLKIFIDFENDTYPIIQSNIYTVKLQVLTHLI